MDTPTLKAITKAKSPTAATSIMVKPMIRRISDVQQTINNVVLSSTVEDEARKLFGEGYILEAFDSLGYLDNIRAIGISLLFRTLSEQEKADGVTPPQDIKIISVNLQPYTVEDSAKRLANWFNRGFRVLKSQPIQTTVQGTDILYFMVKD